MQRDNNSEPAEQGIEVPYKEIAPETLRRMIQEFVTRDGSDWAELGCSLDDKVAQVLEQLKTKQVKVVFDLKSQTANLVPYTKYR
ncbi:MAG: YheU family protein [Syntrophotaleaceae bacterium]